MTNSLEADGTEAGETSFRDRVWTTKGARFNAYRRLVDTKRWATLATSFASSYLIIAAVIPAIGPFGYPKGYSAELSFLIVALGIIVLVLSILEQTRDYRLKAHRLHECGIELTSLHNRMELAVRGKGEGPEDELDRRPEFEREYSEILKRYSDVNHRPIDLQRFRYQNWEHFEIKKWCARALDGWVGLRIKGFYLFMVVVPAVMFVWVLGFAGE